MNKKISIKNLARETSCEISGNQNLIISGVSAVENALDCEICLARTAEYIEKIPMSKGGAFIVSENPGLEGRTFLIHPNPYAVFAKIVALFYPLEKKNESIAETAATGQNFSHGKGVHVGENAVIGNNVVFRDNVYIYPGTVIGDNVVIGDDTRIYPNVTVYSGTEIGKRCIIHSGSVIGSDGFGFAPDGADWIKINHLGKVVISDDVEIGACNTIDRGTFGNTIIGAGVKTDSQVHIAHNVEIGDSTILVGQSGVAGSTKIGRNCIIAGKAGITGHITVGNNVIIGPMAGITGNLKDGSVVSGVPEMPHKLWLKAQRIIPRLPQLRKKISYLEKKIKDIEGQNEQ